ncbi:putative transcriptional regulator, Crp/Fnr family [Mycolicibacterium thermoresistibile]|uniref:Putative transcriptional regulator, Crp/Fnr family n=1 Tax=Mycolicibacterium thermoresistibile TaxID=1797 RepID=A0A100XBC6_MYCTH|nr:putative transcriptional regulator, Crp/Fnr family [Mycolicibacterium thermoresistibile]
MPRIKRRMAPQPTDRPGLDRIDGQGPAVDPPAPWGAQVLVVITQMPDHVGGLPAGIAPVMCDAGDPSQRMIRIGAGRVHLTDDRMLGAGHPRQPRQRRADPVVPVPPPHRLQRARRIR